MGSSHTKINAYKFQVKAFESIGDMAHGDFIVMNKTFIPSINLEYHFYQNFLIIGEQSNLNYVQYLHDNNIDKEISNEENEDNNIYNLKQIELDTEYVEKLKNYYELDKQRKRLFDEIKALS